jgi:hypothetical protein
MKTKNNYRIRKAKPLLDLDLLEKKYNINRRVLFIILISTILFFITKKYFIFAIFAIFSAFFSYYHDRVNKTIIDFKLTLFLGIMITWKFGLMFTFIFFIISDFIPMLLGGGRIEGASILFIAWYFIVNSFVLINPGIDILVYGVILVIVEMLGSTFIKSLFGYPPIIAIGSSIFSIITRIVYFLTFGEIVKFIFQYI